MRKIGILVVLAVAALGAAGWHFRERIAARWQPAGWELRFEPRAVAARPDPEGYATLVAGLARWRETLAAEHRAARNPAARAAAERRARSLLETALPEMMRCWLGTPWDFHGTAAAPGEGPIACGYFVSTVLRDAGFRVDRYRLARQPASNILHSFLPAGDCQLTIDEDYDTFAARTAAREPGVYLTGLDSHVAFLVVGAGGGFRFIHSSGSRPWSVVDEAPGQAAVLRQSRWRMLGHLTADAGVIRRWLRGEKIRVQGA